MQENQTTQETTQVALYARHSGQDEGSIQTQLEAMRSHAEENGLEVVREYTDQNGSRAQFDEMMAEAAGEAAGPSVPADPRLRPRPVHALSGGIPGISGKAGRERRNFDLHHIARRELDRRRAAYGLKRPVTKADRTNTSGDNRSTYAPPEEYQTLMLMPAGTN